jgi:hypothetical protein
MNRRPFVQCFNQRTYTWIIFRNRNIRYRKWGPSSQLPRHQAVHVSVLRLLAMSRSGLAA